MGGGGDGGGGGCVNTASAKQTGASVERATWIRTQLDTSSSRRLGDRRRRQTAVRRWTLSKQHLPLG
jgi:hypothetical protein